MNKITDLPLEESDISGLMHAARNYNRVFLIVARNDEKQTKKFRVRAQSERAAREKFAQHYSQSKILSVEDVTDVNESLGSETKTPNNSDLWSRAKMVAESKFTGANNQHALIFADKWYQQHGGTWKI